MASQTSATAQAQERARNRFVEEPIIWEKVAEYVAEGSEKSLGKLMRSKTQLEHYQKSKKELLAEFASLIDKIKIQDLGFDHTFDKEGKKTASKTASSVDRAIALNDFPYNFESGITHFLLWSLKPLSDDDVNEVLSEHRKEWETIIFENPPSLASLPGLWHMHIVSRRHS